MLTITFIAKSRKTVVSCDSYDVSTDEDGISTIVVYKGIGSEAKTETFEVEVNSDIEVAFTVAYVTNLMGKTIDRIGGSAT